MQQRYQNNTHTVCKVVDLCSKTSDNGVMTNNNGASMNKDLLIYGMTREDIREQYMESITARISGLEMVVMGVLSDAQELLAMGRGESARKQMNVAKFILSEMMSAKETV